MEKSREHPTTKETWPKEAISRKCPSVTILAGKYIASLCFEQNSSFFRSFKHILCWTVWTNENLPQIWGSKVSAVFWTLSQWWMICPKYMLLPKGQVTAGTLRDVCSFGCALLWLGIFQSFLHNYISLMISYVGMVGHVLTLWWNEHFRKIAGSLRFVGCSPNLTAGHPHLLCGFWFLRSCWTWIDETRNQSWMFACNSIYFLVFFLGQQLGRMARIRMRNKWWLQSQILASESHFASENEEKQNFTLIELYGILGTFGSLSNFFQLNVFCFLVIFFKIMAEMWVIWIGRDA